MVGYVFMQPIESSIANDADIFRNIVEEARLPEVLDVMDRTSCCIGDSTDESLLIDEDGIFVGMSFLLTRVMLALPFVIFGSLHWLLGGIDDGKEIRMVSKCLFN